MATRRVEIPTSDDVDKEKLFVCPYNLYHKISALKYPSHVANCRKLYTGNKFERCPFNARHLIPAVEYDYHCTCCPDKKLIDKELSVASAPNVPQVDHHPEWSNIQPTEDWDTEADNAGFSLSGQVTMVAPERTAYDVMNEFHDQLEERACQPQEEQRSAFAGDMSSLSKAQKKNMKRAMKRREKYQPDVDDDGDNEQADRPMTAEEQEYQLQQIAREYSAPGRQYSEAFVDWVSILNIYCQKNKINQPKYSEAPNSHGGFGSSVVVTTQRFFSGSYCGTKKEAKHSAARAALLGLKIAVSLPDPCRDPRVGSSNLEQLQQLEQRREMIESRMTSGPRLIPGLNPTQPAPPSQATPQVQSAAQPVVSQMAKMTIDNQTNEDDQWQVAGKKKGGNKNLRLAGVGRGRARR